VSVAGPMPTLWSGDGGAAALAGSRDLLAECQPPAVQLHTWAPAGTARDVRKLVPGVTLVVGVGVDGVAKECAEGRQSVESARRTLVGLAQRASDVGAVAICWNAEAQWKRAPNTEEKARLSALVTSTLAEVRTAHPSLEQWHTSYDHPHYHSAYPWADWLGRGSPVVVSLPQVYAAPKGDVLAHRGALPAREARALASWREAIRRGWIRPDAPEGTPEDLTDCDWRPYYQLHHVRASDTVAGSVRHPFAAFWALPSRADREGRNAFRALCDLHRRRLWRPGGVEALQRELGVTADGAYGPRTAAAARVRWEMSI
jgi:hypothetical protein